MAARACSCSCRGPLQSVLLVAVVLLISISDNPILELLAATHHFRYVITCLTSQNCRCEGWNVSTDVKQAALRLQMEQCGYCKGYESVDRVSMISCEEYMKVYGLTGRPVIVTDAMNNWDSSLFIEELQQLSLQNYRDIYHQAVKAERQHKVFGSFFDILAEDPDHGRYSTPEKFFSTIDQVVMNDTWYINWITDDMAMFRFFDRFVKDPYFFAPWSTHPSQMWFFIGRLAEGERLEGRSRHVDSVRMSGTWHGQLLGEKEWQLWPAGECQHICPEVLTVTVKKGEMILLNTDLWEHETSMPLRTEEQQFSFSIAKDFYLSSRFLLRNIPRDPFKTWFIPWHYTFESSDPESE